MASPSWLTTTEASKIAGVTNRYLRRLCDEGVLNARLRGNSWLIEPTSFKNWHTERNLKKQKIKDK